TSGDFRAISATFGARSRTVHRAITGRRPAPPCLHPPTRVTPARVRAPGRHSRRGCAAGRVLDDPALHPLPLFVLARDHRVTAHPTHTLAHRIAKLVD